MRLSRLLLALLLPLALGGAVVGLLVHAGDGGVAPSAAPASQAAEAAPVPLRTVALTILRRWDAQRAEAWATGETAALARLYTRGSVAGRRDAAMLRRWTRRGLAVAGLRMQVLAVEVRSWSAERLVLAVTDRVAAGTAVGRGTRAALPRDAVSARVMAFRRVGGEWRLARVRPLSGPR